MNKSFPSWTQLFQTGYIENYICLVIKAYQDVGAESRTEVKKEFYITAPIGYEVGERTKRMDICCYLEGLREDYYICFECKRFLKNTTTKSQFEDEYYGEGIKRFENNEYSSRMPEAGMISFLETGNLDKLKKLMEIKLPEKAVDRKAVNCSLKYSFCYVYRTIHKRKNSQRMISLYHILLDFT